MSRFANTHRPQGRDLGLVPLCGLGDVIVGNVPVEVTKPDGCTTIVLRVDNRNFFIAPGTFAADYESDDFDSGDFDSMFDDPAATTYDTADEGLVAWKLAEGAERAFLCPSTFTIKGDAADAKIYFYFF